MRRALITGVTGQDGAYLAELLLAKVHEVEWLPLSARSRVVIWHSTATEYMKRPLLGVGADATIKVQPGYERAQGGRRESWGYLVTIERHAHNAYLQVWFELGAIGALLLCGILVALLRALRALPRPVRPFAAAYLATAGALLFSSYGLWQLWMQSSIALGAFALLVTARALPPASTDGGLPPNGQPGPIP